MSEAELYGQILTKFSLGYTRLFRQNAGGVAWQGTVIEHTPQRLILLNPRAIKLGVTGISDLIGWSPLFTGARTKPLALFTAIEGKSATGRVRPEQAAFIETVLRCGGRAGIARSVEEAGRIILCES